MILLKEDFDNLQRAIALLQMICKNAVLSEIEEESDRKIRKAVENLKISDNKGILKFTKKELKQMPDDIKEKLQKDFLHTRQKANGVYELRLTYKGNKYYGCSKDFNEARRQFIESIINTAKMECAAAEPPAPAAPALGEYTVCEYAEHYLELFKKPYVSDKHYNNYMGMLKNHFMPFFRNTKISEITATQCQGLLNAILDDGKGRICEDIDNLLRWICGAALADGILKTNPMLTVKIPKHRRKPGKQIPVQLMEKYLSAPPKHKYEYFIWLIAYSGFRPCEIKSIKYADGFLTVQNAKQKKGEDPTFRRIPVHSELKPYINEILQNLDINTDYLGQIFHKHFPKEYRLYDLRHTFTSRIQECKAIKAWVDYATNHTDGQNTTDKVYTHWSDAFQVSEIEKLSYKSQNQSQV